MVKIKAKHICNPWFMLALLLLILNDHFFKYQYPSWFTGKLSDLVGLIVLVQVLRSLNIFKQDLWNFGITILAFTLWKTPLVDHFIYAWNHHFSAFRIQRTIDYTDLLAILILIPWHKYGTARINYNAWNRRLFYPVLTLAFCSLCATSYVRALSTNYIYVYDTFKLKLTPQEFEDKLRTENLKYTQDSILVDSDTFKRYLINDYVLNQDTIHEIICGIRPINKRKSELLVATVKIDQDSSGTTQFSYGHGSPGNYKEYKRLKKKFKVELKDEFKLLED